MEATAEKEARMVTFVNQAITTDDGEFIACLAKEGETGYYKTDWIWGKDFAIAQEAADKRNEVIGISKREAAKIVLSTMR